MIVVGERLRLSMSLQIMTLVITMVKPQFMNFN